MIRGTRKKGGTKATTLRLKKDRKAGWGSRRNITLTCKNNVGVLKPRGRVRLPVEIGCPRHSVGDEKRVRSSLSVWDPGRRKIPERKGRREEQIGERKDAFATSYSAVTNRARREMSQWNGQRNRYKLHNFKGKKKELQGLLQLADGGGRTRRKYERR